MNYSLISILFFLLCVLEQVKPDNIAYPNCPRALDETSTVAAAGYHWQLLSTLQKIDGSTTYDAYASVQSDDGKKKFSILTTIPHADNNEDFFMTAGRMLDITSGNQTFQAYRLQFKLLNANPPITNAHYLLQSDTPCVTNVVEAAFTAEQVQSVAIYHLVRGL